MRSLIGIVLLVSCAPNTSETEVALQCTQSDGDWVEVADCPTSCPPPAPSSEACATIEEMACAAVCGDIAACHCPHEKPFWQEGEGCVGFEACPEREGDTWD